MVIHLQWSGLNEFRRIRSRCKFNGRYGKCTENVKFTCSSLMQGRCPIQNLKSWASLFSQLEIPLYHVCFIVYVCIYIVKFTSFLYCPGLAAILIVTDFFVVYENWVETFRWWSAISKWNPSPVSRCSTTLLQMPERRVKCCGHLVLKIVNVHLGFSCSLFQIFWLPVLEKFFKTILTFLWKPATVIYRN